MGPICHILYVATPANQKIKEKNLGTSHSLQGGGLQNGRGGVKFYPYKKWGSKKF